jgi:hypothetical protein
MCNILQSCGPRSEVIVWGTPEQVIQEETKSRVHATTEISKAERFHPFGCVVSDFENVVATSSVL